MSHPFRNAPTALSTDAIKQDVSDILKWNKYIQRYSTSRDSLVTLCREFDEFVMKDTKTGSEHRLSVDFTKTDRLLAHWTHFTYAHAANL